MNTLNKKELLNRMKMFSARTVENGCSESEAMLAAKKLSELQTQYNVTLTELDITQVDFIIDDFNLGKRQKHPVTCCLFGLQAFCEIKIVFFGNSAEIFGERHKVDNAKYMINLLMLTMDLEFNKFKTSYEYADLKMRYHGRKIRADFMNSMGYRISSRLSEMARIEKNEVIKTTGNSLVVLADAKLLDAYKKKYPSLRTGSGRGTGNSGASNAGRMAGNRASLNRGVGSNSGGTLRLA